MALQKYVLNQLAGMNKQLGQEDLPNNVYSEMYNMILEIQNGITRITTRDGLTKLTTLGGTDGYITALVSIDTGDYNSTIIAFDNNLDTKGAWAYSLSDDITINPTGAANQFVLISGSTSILPINVPIYPLYNGNLSLSGNNYIVYNNPLTLMTNSWNDVLVNGIVHNQRIVGNTGPGLIFSQVGISNSINILDSKNDSLIVSTDSFLSNGQDYIISYISLGEIIYVFSLFNITVWSVPTIFEKIRLLSKIDLKPVATYGQLEINGKIYCVTKSGFYELSNPFVNLAYSISEYWKTIFNSIPSVFESYNVYPVYTIYDEKNNNILIAFNKGSYNWDTFTPTWSDNEILVYSLDLQNFISRFTLFEGENKYITFCKGLDGTIYVSANSDLYKFDSAKYKDDTTDFSFDFKSSYLGNDTMYNFKQPKEFALKYQLTGLASGNLTLNYNPNPIADLSNPATSSTSVTIPLISGNGIRVLNDLQGRGRMCEVELTGTLNGKLSISKAVLTCDIEGEN